MLVNLAWVVLILYVSWWLYLGAMNVERVYEDGRLTTKQKILVAPMLLFFLFVDVLVLNVIIGTLFFWEIPKKWTLTSRLSRWKSNPSYKGKVAKWICEHMLNPFDSSPGGHC